MTEATSTPNPDSIAERAWTLIELRRWKDAVAEAQRALLLNPRHFNALYNLSVAQRHAGDAAGAEQTARTLIGYYPNNASAYNMLSRALKNQRRYTDAIAASREAARLSPNDADLWINLSDVLMSAKLFNEGTEACEKAITLNPNLPMAHNNYAVGLEEFHLDTEAETEYRAAMTLDPLNPLFHSNLGWLKYKQKAYLAAVHHFHEALMLEPTKPEYRRSLDSALRKAYPLRGWWLVGLGLVVAVPLAVLAVLLALGLKPLAWSLFAISLLSMGLNVLVVGSRVKTRIHDRYLRQKLKELTASQH